MATVRHTNRRWLDSYSGGDGIKTGYTRAAGFNLVASAQRGQERVIATVFGGSSTSARNARITELMDMGFNRAPSSATIRRPNPPAAMVTSSAASPGKTIRLSGLVTRSVRPTARPMTETVPDPAIALIAATAVPAATTEPVAIASAAPAPVVDTDLINAAVNAALQDALGLTPEADAPDVLVAAIEPIVRPSARPVSEETIIASAAPAEQATVTAPPEVVTRISTSGGRHWGVNVGRFDTRHNAERVLLRVALNEMTALDGALRRVVQRSGGFDANFMGLTREGADLACRRLQARGTTCFMIGSEG
jgi:D-alanyl-D-alanine carboxypeptidase